MARRNNGSGGCADTWYPTSHYVRFALYSNNLTMHRVVLRMPGVLRIRGSAHKGFDPIAYPDNAGFNNLGIHGKTGSGKAWQ